MLHSYSSWDVVEAGGDLGCWLASARLIRETPWAGEEFTADADYLARLRALAGKYAVVGRPLFVHN
jgi:hypothetical protein